MSSLDSLLDIILSNTYEVDVLHHRLALWRSLLEKHLFSEGTEENFAKDAKQQLSLLAARAAEEQGELPEHIEAVEAWMRTARLLTRDTVYDLFDELKNAIAALPVLALSVAVNFSRKEREDLGTWAREHVHPRLLLNLQRDPSLLGGAAIIWNNKQDDRSLRARLQNQRPALREFLASEVRSLKRSS